MESRNFTCIIPFYNEGQQLLFVVAAVAKIKLINQIVCVDDGSTDNSARLLMEKYPQVTLLKLKDNLGKSAAVAKGLPLAKNENILLLDADLRRLKSQEIERALVMFTNTPFIDMLVLENKSDNTLLEVVFRNDILLSGKRILKKKDLLAVLRRKTKGFQLETAINKYMMSHYKIVRWMRNSALNPSKTRKYGFVEGLGRDLKMEFDIISYAGVGHYLKQMALFCREEIL